MSNSSRQAARLIHSYTRTCGRFFRAPSSFSFIVTGEADSERERERVLSFHSLTSSNNLLHKTGIVSVSRPVNARSMPALSFLFRDQEQHASLHLPSLPFLPSSPFVLLLSRRPTQPLSRCSEPREHKQRGGRREEDKTTTTRGCIMCIQTFTSEPKHRESAFLSLSLFLSRLPHPRLFPCSFHFLIKRSNCIIAYEAHIRLHNVCASATYVWKRASLLQL